MTVFLIIRQFIRITELEIVLGNWQMPATYLTYFVPITPSISMFLIFCGKHNRILGSFAINLYTGMK